MSAEFQISDNRIQFPNSVLASLRPISPQYTDWIRHKKLNSVRRDHILKTPYNKILTFGIFGRDFERDSPYPSSSHVAQTDKILILLFIVTIFTMFNLVV